MDLGPLGGWIYKTSKGDLDMYNCIEYKYVEVKIMSLKIEVIEVFETFSIRDKSQVNISSEHINLK